MTSSPFSTRQWSFMVAVLLFSLGGMFSIDEGIHKFLEPEPIERFALGLGILAFSIFLEGGATLSNIREVNRRRGARSWCGKASASI